MLPATPTHRTRLAEVLPNCLEAVLGRGGELPSVRHAAVILVDGLGAAALRSRAGHARTLAPLLNKRTTIRVGFPTTTASSIATLTTGALPGEHGMLGYSVVDPAGDRVVNQLSGWDQRMDPASWQPLDTVFQRATEQGVPSFVIAPARYADSEFTRAVLRGADYVSANTVNERLAQLRQIMTANSRSLNYLYIPELDTVAHRYGIESAEWTNALETLDAAIAGLRRGMRAGEGVLITGDHGLIDVPRESHVILDPELLRGIRHLAGEPRCLQLHLDDGISLDETKAAWTAAYGDVAWIASREEIVASGLLGALSPEHAPRFGDLVVGARKRIAFYRDEDSPARGMIGQHGSLSPDEDSVPLIGLGAFG